MESLFKTIEDKRQLDKLLAELRAAHRSAVAARDTAKDIVSRKIPQPEWIRTINRKLFPQLQQMVLDFRETIAEVKEQRSNVQSAQRDNDSSRVARETPDSGATPGS